MKTNTIKVEILEDGTISVTTDDLAGPNHRSADELLDQLADLTGGAVTKRKRSRFELGVDLGGALREHTHDGHTHTY
jgi:hypothetical protein